MEFARRVLGNSPLAPSQKSVDNHEATFGLRPVFLGLRPLRLGRSLQHLVGFLEEIHALKIDLYLHVQGLDTTTPAGKALFQMLGVFSEFERAMIQERVKAGLARARAQGKAIGRPKVNGQVEKKVRELRAGGMGIKRIAKEARVAVGTVYRILKTAA